MSNSTFAMAPYFSSAPVSTELLPEFTLLRRQLPSASMRTPLPKPQPMLPSPAKPVLNPASSVGPGDGPVCRRTRVSSSQFAPAPAPT